MKKTLAIETSCDDTSAAIVSDDGRVFISLFQSQNLSHRPFGGVVPENASRAHSRHLLPLIDLALKNTAMDEIDVLSCTNRPGLMGSLLSGWVTVKTLALAFGKPFIGVNHIEGHILSPFIYDKEKPRAKNFDFPYIALVASGGHTHLFLAEKLSCYRLIGQTLDDAAGEAFDKFAKLLGLPYPGGVEVDRLAQKGRDDAFVFPKVLAERGNLHFSFSGLKSSALRRLEQMSQKEIEERRADLCASFQKAIVDQIIFKLGECAEKYPLYKNMAVVGGVSANSALRKACFDFADLRGLRLVIPPPRYCTDNAAMIGYTGLSRFLRGETSLVSEPCSPRFFPKDFHSG